MKILMALTVMCISTHSYAWLGGEISNGASNTQICTKTVGSVVHTCSTPHVVVYQSAGKDFCNCDNNALVTGGTVTTVPVVKKRVPAQVNRVQ